MKVYTYPVTDGYQGREGWAVEFEPGRFRDTYSETEGIELTAKEIEGLHFQFDTEEFDELTGRADGSAPAIWATYASENRHLIPSQGGRSKRWFVRKATDPDTGMEQARERREIEDAEQTIQFAQMTIAIAKRRIESAQFRLEVLEARPH